MVWHTLPRQPAAVHRWPVNYRLVERGGLAGEAGPAHSCTDLVGPYADLFAYHPAVAGDEHALIEGLLRLGACSARLDAVIPALWQNLAANGLTMAEDPYKQSLDRLFGLDGRAGLLGALKRYRRIAANDLPKMSPGQQAEFLGALLAFADGLHPGNKGVDIWQSNSARYALPLYLQDLALIVLVQGWIGDIPGTAGQAAKVRQRAFLAGLASDLAPEITAVLQVAAQALRC